MEDRSKLLHKVKSQNSTHECSNCKEPTYCAMEAGKSANLCWCMTVEKDENPSVPEAGTSCLCRQCLTDNN